MTQDTTSLPAASSGALEMPYAPSWIDWLTAWIARIPGPAWAFYVAALLIFALTNNAVFWIDGALAVGTFDLVRTADAGFIVFFIALYHYLALVAHQSLVVFRPALAASDADVQIIDYRLTTLPRRLGWLALIVGIIGGVVSVQSDPAGFGLDMTSTWLQVVYQTSTMAFVFAAFITWLIQMIRQLRLIIALHRQASYIDIFQLTPLHAFARFTARVGMTVILFVAFNGLLRATGEDGAPLWAVTIMTVLAVCVFVIPLLGMRNRLQDEKERRLSEANEAIKVIIARVHDQVSADTYDKIPGLNASMTALVAERDLIQEISTWPWDPSTLKGFATTLLLPIFLWLVTRLLERLI